MSIEFTVDRDCGCVVTRIEGLVTEAQVIDYFDRLRGTPGYSPALPRLVDVRRVDEMLRPAEIREIAEVVRTSPHIYGGKRALVAERDVVYGMLRMFELLTSQAGGYRAFRDVHEAAEWLRVADCPAVRELMAENACTAHAGG